MKEYREAGGGRMLLGDNIGGRAVLLPPLRFRCFNRTTLHIDTQLTTCIPNCDLLQTFRNVKCCVKSGTVCAGVGLRVISGAQTTLMSSHTNIKYKDGAASGGMTFITSFIKIHPPIQNFPSHTKTRTQMSGDFALG